MKFSSTRGHGGLEGVLATGVSRRDLGKLAGLAAGAGLLGSRLAPSVAAQEQGSGGAISIPRSGDANTLDPHHTVSGVAYQTFRYIYEPLIAQDIDLNMEGILAETWEISEDGLEYTFHLRQGIKFQDGTDFNADAVKFTFDRVTNPETNAPSLGWVSALTGTEVVDPYTIKMTLNEAFSPFLTNISVEYFGIISPAAVEQYGEEFGLNPVGTGPWQLKEWVSGERITLVPYPEHQNFHSYIDTAGPPTLDELNFLNMLEEQTQLAAFETGQVNVVGVPPREIERFRDDGYQLFTAESVGSIWYTEFATAPLPEGETFGVTFLPPFDDLLLRQAVAHATNADEMIATVMEGQAARNYGPMPMGLFAYDPAIEEFGYHFDLDKAKSLLAEAGWEDADGDGIVEKDGAKLEIVIATWTDSLLERLLQVIQNQLLQAGIGVKIEMQEAGAFFSGIGELSGYNMIFMIWTWSEPDILYMMTDTNWGVGQYRPQAFKDLLLEARRVTDQDARKALYFEAQKVLLADAPMVPLWTNTGTTAFRPEVKGLTPGPQNGVIFHTAWIED